MLTERELAERRLTVSNAIATQRLEGLEVDPATIADLERWARGELELTTAREQALARIEATRLRDLAETGKLSVENAFAEHARHILNVQTLAAETFGDPLLAMQWMLRPNGTLKGGGRPLDVLTTQAGFDRVCDVLTRLEHGIGP
ncbi:MAG: antitoxin Xre/MbcA/ParS toxin-binding domain-containing protein [Paraburkholderia sp.]|uniref:antitoxin VbhA family protein n=1 Tax=Paraburkholderia sp. TaxID=1926495 RepID=UPI003C4C5E71